MVLPVRVYPSSVVALVLGFGKPGDHFLRCKALPDLGCGGPEGKPPLRIIHGELPQGRDRFAVVVLLQVGKLDPEFFGDRPENPFRRESASQLDVEEEGRRFVNSVCQLSERQIPLEPQLPDPFIKVGEVPPPDYSIERLISDRM